MPDTAKTTPQPEKAISDRGGEKRVPLRIPVQIWGRNKDGKPFLQDSIALNISRSGALISEVPQQLRAGDLLNIRYGPVSALFRVVWTSNVQNTLQQNVAVHRFTSEPCPWLDLLPTESASPEDSCTVTLHQQEPVSGSSEQDPCSRCEHNARRRWRRCHVDEPIRAIVHTKDKTIVVPGRGTAISRGGMAVTAGIEANPGDEIGIEFTPAYSGPIRIQGVVRNRKGYQYGIEFRASHPEEAKACERLEALLASLGSEAQRR